MWCTDDFKVMEFDLRDLRLSLMPMPCPDDVNCDETGQRASKTALCGTLLVGVGVLPLLLLLLLLT